MARLILVCGHLRDDDRAAIVQAAHDAPCDLEHIERSDAALAWIERNTPAGVFCGLDILEELTSKMRCQAEFSRMPMLALADSPSDLDYGVAFASGADDIAPVTPPRALLWRLRALPGDRPPPLSSGRGTALVAEPERGRRTAVARVLRNAGFSVSFAVRERDALQLADETEYTLIVVNEELLSDPLQYVANAARGQSSIIVGTAPKHVKSQRQKLAGVPRVVVTDGFAAPENVLFAANELTMDRSSGRSSPRIVFGTRVAFRAAGHAFDDHGFSYNISARGIYVRTIVPLAEDEVWLELCPPRMDRYVRLVGKVAWRRPFNYNENATVPPGFGVQIVDGARRDLELWEEGYDELYSQIG
jgi:DNA-binding response OmpR family regulator